MIRVNVRYRFRIHHSSEKNDASKAIQPASAPRPKPSANRPNHIPTDPSVANQSTSTSISQSTNQSFMQIDLEPIPPSNHCIIPIDCVPYQTISMLKQDIIYTRARSINSPTDPPLNNQTILPPGRAMVVTLTFQGRVLRDADTVAQSGLTDQSYVHAVAFERPCDIPKITHSVNPPFSHINTPVPRVPNPAEMAIAELNQLISPALIAPLTDMGFSESRSLKALLINLLNTELAVQWLIEHSDDPDIDDPLPEAVLASIATAVQAHRRATDGTMNRQVEQAISQQICTFTLSERSYVSQNYYECRTCNLSGTQGICQSCVAVCHVGHDIEGPRPSSSFFCDCGAGDGPQPCMCLTPRPTPEPKAPSPQPKPAKVEPTDDAWIDFRVRLPFRTLVSIDSRHPYSFLDQVNFYYSFDSGDAYVRHANRQSLTDPTEHAMLLALNSLHDHIYMSINRWLDEVNSCTLLTNHTEQRTNQLIAMFHSAYTFLTNPSIDRVLKREVFNSVNLLIMIVHPRDCTNPTIKTYIMDMFDWFDTFIQSESALLIESQFEPGTFDRAVIDQALTNQALLFDMLGFALNATAVMPQSDLARKCLSFVVVRRPFFSLASDFHVRVRASQLCHNLALLRRRNCVTESTDQSEHKSNDQSNKTLIDEKQLLECCIRQLDDCSDEFRTAEPLIVALCVMLVDATPDIREYAIDLGIRRALEPHVAIKKDQQLTISRMLQRMIEYRGK